MHDKTPYTLQCAGLLDVLVSLRWVFIRCVQVCVHRGVLSMVSSCLGGVEAGFQRPDRGRQ